MLRLILNQNNLVGFLLKPLNRMCDMPQYEDDYIPLSGSFDFLSLMLTSTLHTLLSYLGRGCHLYILSMF